MAIKSSSRNGARVKYVGVHTAEGARKAGDLWNYFNRSDVNASSHEIIDAFKTLPTVDHARAAWTLRSGNPISVNVELCAFARWTRAQWMSEGTVDGCVNPKAMLHRVADWIRWCCDRHGIPKVKLSSNDVRNGKSGVIGHINWTEGKNDGSHWDPGPNFPWDYVMSLVNGNTGGGSTPPAPTTNHDLLLLEDNMREVTAKGLDVVQLVTIGLPGLPGIDVVVNRAYDGFRVHSAKAYGRPGPDGIAWKGFTTGAQDCAPARPFILQTEDGATCAEVEVSGDVSANPIVVSFAKR